jgi:hypothetical protein
MLAKSTNSCVLVVHMGTWLAHIIGRFKKTCAEHRRDQSIRRCDADSTVACAIVTKKSIRVAGGLDFHDVHCAFLVLLVLVKGIPMDFQTAKELCCSVRAAIRMENTCPPLSRSPNVTL